MIWRHRLLLAVAAAFVPAVASEGTIPVVERANLARAEATLARIEADNDRLARRIAEVEAEVRALSSDEAEIECIARQQLHLIRPDEVVYRLRMVREAASAAKEGPL